MNISVLATFLPFLVAKDKFIQLQEKQALRKSHEYSKS